MKEKLIGMVVGDRDGDIGVERLQAFPVFNGQQPDAIHRFTIFRIGQGEELRCVGHADAADDTRPGFHAVSFVRM